MSWGAGGAAAEPAPGASSQVLYFDLDTGPEHDRQRCTVVGELFTPAGASSATPVPAVLTTNGFARSYEDQLDIARSLSAEGYAVLAYSGLGFGGSGCRVTMDHPDYDGRAASQLVSFLGGADGIAYADPELTVAVPGLDHVVRDETDHHGNPSEHDPRVGMIGGSYGGGVQFAAASVDPRIDTLVPMITWNDLSHSLQPNGAHQVDGVTSSVTGATKVRWAATLFAGGVASAGFDDGYVADPTRLTGCPNYPPFMCEAIAQTAATGTVDDRVLESFREASVASYLDRISVPVFLTQGYRDTLFTLNEAVATYEGLRARDVPVKMLWHEWGHDQLVPEPGDFGFDYDDRPPFQTRRILDWFDHYLRDVPVDTGPEFEYFRPWAQYDGDTEPAYGSAASYPVGSDRDYHLSADGVLASEPGQQGTRTLTAGPLPVLTDTLGDVDRVEWTTHPLTAPVDVVGVPRATLQFDSPGESIVFVSVADVAPDGTSTVIGDLVTPVRTGPGRVDVQLAGIAHRFEAGHAIRLTVTGADPEFVGQMTLAPVTLGSGQTLTLPTVG
ncbi:ABC transporter ATP-binding protein [Rhodococcus triatomae]|nr:ABC transporter ATP-binding protein [Rhodococcus triatomae]QNG25790.1 ABC transporter ATP-binding protein [Rhodococcus triatomae]